MNLREYNALRAVYLRAHNVEVHTPEEWRQKEAGERYIREQWIKARNKVYGGNDA